MTIRLRAATRDDAADMAMLVNLAGEGMPKALWARQADYGTDPLTVGAARAQRDYGVLSWVNTTVAELDGELAGIVISCPVGADPVEVDSDTHPMMRPLIKLQNHAPDTRFVNVVATKPIYQRKGVATALMDATEDQSGRAGMSVIVAGGNQQAADFFAHRAYRTVEETPLIRGDWNTDHTTWKLLRHP